MGSIRRIAMFSTHGYFDPVPELGKTDTGGQVLYLLRLARALVGLGVPVDIYTRWFDRDRRRIDPLPGCPEARVVRIRSGPWEFIPKEFIYDTLDELVENAVGFIRDEGLEYDVVHGHYVDGGIVALDVARALGKPVFFTAHSLGAWKRQRLGGDPEEMDRIFNFAHRVSEELRIFEAVNAQTLTSREEGEKIEELYGYRHERTQFIPPGVDVAKFRPLASGETEAETGHELEPGYVFVVGRLAKAKGHALLLDAFRRVLERVPDARLVIGGGSSSPDEEEQAVLEIIRRFRQEEGLGERVIATGGIDHDALPPYFRKAALFVLPASYEPFGMTVLEAMACGTPAVVSSFAGIHEVLEHGRDCLVVDPNDAGELAGAIVSLLEDRALASRLGGAAAATVQQGFSWEAIARSHLEFYEKWT